MCLLFRGKGRNGEQSVWSTFSIDHGPALTQRKRAEIQRVLTNDRTRLPYMYMGTDTSQHVAWHAPRTSSDDVNPYSTKTLFTKKVAL